MNSVGLPTPEQSFQHILAEQSTKAKILNNPIYAKIFWQQRGMRNNICLAKAEG